MIKDYPSYLDAPREKKKQTNFDKIKAMTIEEMAASHYTDCSCCNFNNQISCTGGNCEKGIKEWLESEVTE